VLWPGLPVLWPGLLTRPHGLIGRHAVSGSQDRTVTVWDAQTSQELLTLKGHTSSVNERLWLPTAAWYDVH
jgi:WD40 repeat protein